MRITTSTAGTVLLLAAGLIGCCLPALLEPQPPWHDITAEQTAWHHEVAWLLGTAGLLLLVGWLLLAYAWTTVRKHR